jgi:hypothetical protein
MKTEMEKDTLSENEIEDLLREIERTLNEALKDTVDRKTKQKKIEGKKKEKQT